MKTVLRHGSIQIGEANRLSFPPPHIVTATGRQALYLMARELRCRRVLLPGFVPDGLVLPFARAGWDVQFYRLMPTLAPDLSDLFGRIGAQCLVVVIHYFGVIVDTAAIVQRAHLYDSLLLEDCAHALLHRPVAAHFALYSLNKFLPVTDGAVLTASDSYSHILVKHDRAPWPEMPDDARMAYIAHLRNNEQLAERGPGETTVRLAQQSADAYYHYYGIMGHKLEPMRPSAEADFAMLADITALDPKPWTAHRVRSREEMAKMSVALWRREIAAVDASQKWHVPTGHPPQHFLLVPAGTEEAVFDAFTEIHR